MITKNWSEIGQSVVFSDFWLQISQIKLEFYQGKNRTFKHIVIYKIFICYYIHKQASFKR